MMGNDTISGGGGNDYLEGGADQDSLTGSAGNDHLHGGQGNDTLVGGKDNDWLEGGLGVDRYEFTTGDGIDVIKDADGQGTLVINGAILNAANGTEQSGEYEATLAGKKLKLLWSGQAGTELKVIYGDGGKDAITIAKFKNGDFGLNLTAKPVDYKGTKPGATAGADIIQSGGAIYTKLAGGEGNDFINASLEAEAHGQDGNDIIIAGTDPFKTYQETWQLSYQPLAGTPLHYEIMLLNEFGQQSGTTSRDVQPGSRAQIALSTGKTVYSDEHWASMTGGMTTPNKTIWESALSFNGGKGDDWLQSNGGQDTLIGGEGADLLVGGHFQVNFQGGKLDFDTDKGDLLLGGQGNDTLYGFRGDDTLDGGEQDDALFGEGDHDLLSGGEGNDTLFGDYTFRSQYQLSKGGDDTLLGGAGDDFLDGGEGTDSLFGEAGNDYLANVLKTDTTGDYLDGGDGDDTIAALGGADTLIGGAGNDILTSGVSDFQDTVGDTLDGGDGNDTLTGSHGSDLIFGGDGHDQISASLNPAAGLSDSLYGGSGNDTIVGSAISDLVNGEDGDDILRAGDGNDTLVAGSGLDLLEGGLGNDTYDVNGGGKKQIKDVAGYDTLLLTGISSLDDVTVLQSTSQQMVLRLSGTGENDIYIDGGFKGAIDHFVNGTVSPPPVNPQARSAIASDASNNTPSVQSWDLKKMAGRATSSLTLTGDYTDEVFYGGQANDFIDGNGGNDVLDSNNGADALYGRDGNDTLIGGLGADQLDGGAGSDTYRFERGDGQDLIIDNPQRGTGEADVLMMGTGIRAEDLTLARQSADLIISLKGTTDRVTVKNYFNGEGIEQITFQDGSVVLDTATINAGVLIGSDANDYLSGYQTNDKLAGGKGNDTLEGMGGSDTYHFNRGDGQDTLSDGNGGNANDMDVLAFGPGILPEHLQFKRHYNNLVVSLRDSTDQVEILNFFTAPNIESFTFQGGATNLSAAQVKILLLQGTAGNDQLLGYQGDDTLDGLAGNDQLDGQTGRDTYRFGRGDGQDTVLGSQSGKEDTIAFKAGISPIDIKVSRSDNDLLLSIKNSDDSIRITDFFGPQSQVSQVTFADNTIWSVPTLMAKLLDATEGDDTLVGYNTADVISGLGGRDRIDGAAGNDKLYGNAGDDDLYGNTGDDTLEGGIGDDMLGGGDGSDTYLYRKGDGNDTITVHRFGNTIDTLLLTGGIKRTDIRIERSDQRQDRNHLFIKLVDGSTIRLANFFGGAENDNGAIQLKFDDGTLIPAEDVRKLAWSATEGADTLHGTGQADVMLALGGNDTLYGYDGDDVLEGGIGDDQIFDGQGNDRVMGGSGNDTLWGDREDPFQLTSGNDVFEGGAGNDEIHSNNGRDTVIWGHGAGNDTVHLATSWRKAIQNRLQFTEGVRPENIVLTRDNATLYVKSTVTNETITLHGYFDGLDTQVSDASDFQFADGTIWNKQLILAKTNQATERHDYLTGTAGNDQLQGLGGNDQLQGMDGNDTLRGGKDHDLLVGGLGQDAYLFDRGDGIDTIAGGSTSLNSYSSLAEDELRLGQGLKVGDIRLLRYNRDLLLDLGQGDGIVLADHFDIGDNAPPMATALRTVRLADGTVFNLATEYVKALGTPQATAGNDRFTGTFMSDTLSGDKGNDTLLGLQGDDALDGGADNDSLDGGDGNDTLYGQDGADVLISGGGQANWLYGGKGDDIYRIAGSMDYVFEMAGEGKDQIEATMDVVLPDQVENLVLQGSAINGAGNELANSITGNGLSNRLQGLAGNDTLIGGNGQDTLEGGGGNDTYYSEGNDTITELANGGTDILYTSASVTKLVDHVENLTLMGSTDLNGVGNHLANTLTGNAGKNSLSGLDGHDKLDGGAGNDTLDGGVGNDTLKGGLGDDRYVFAGNFGTDV
ncbi:calcium-binding protein, partial [Chitinivorax sp. B]|uniref:calcium-binding protein n=1 Tax=Chitinivorax sp. B TaxID=2502235 RepID=UPI0024B5F072